MFRFTLATLLAASQTHAALYKEARTVNLPEFTLKSDNMQLEPKIYGSTYWSLDEHGNIDLRISQTLSDFHYFDIIEMK